MKEISIEINPQSKGKLTIHPETLKTIGTVENGKMDIRFGTHSVLTTVTVNDSIAEKSCILSFECAKELQLPPGCQFKGMFDQGALNIGPYVGILAATTNKKLKRKVKKLVNYLKHYNQIGGAVIAFSLEGVEKKANHISGYLYNPKKSKWEWGTFPYPGSFYRKVTMKKRWRNHFEKKIGPNFFNYKNLSKWDVHQILNQFDSIQEYLPFTTLYTEPEDLLSRLQNETTVFLKPLSGLKGKNIKEIQKECDLYTVRYRKGDKNYMLNLDDKGLIEYLTSTVTSFEYLVQQKLNLVFHQNRVTDFRLFVTKNQSGDWKCLGWVGRNGVPNSIVSNRSSGGIVESGDETLKNILNLTNKELPIWREKVFQIACDACQCFDKKNMNYGYFAIDIGIGVEKKIWILEMNHRSPNDALPLYVGDRALYEQIKLSKMLYLKYLAGFSKE